MIATILAQTIALWARNVRNVLILQHTDTLAQMFLDIHITQPSLFRSTDDGIDPFQIGRCPHVNTRKVGIGATDAVGDSTD